METVRWTAQLSGMRKDGSVSLRALPFVHVVDALQAPVLANYAVSLPLSVRRTATAVRRPRAGRGGSIPGPGRSAARVSRDPLTAASGSIASSRNGGVVVPTCHRRTDRRLAGCVVGRTPRTICLVVAQSSPSTSALPLPSIV